MFKEHIFGHDALLYITEELVHGQTLANHLLDLDLTRGKILTCLPSSVTDQEALQFRGIIRFDYPTVPLWTKIGNVVSRYMSGGNNRYTLFENAVRDPDDMSRDNLDSPVCYFNQEVCHLLNQEQCTPEKVINARVKAFDYPFVGIVTYLPERVTISHHENLTEDKLKLLAHNTQLMLVGAYDAIGHLEWHRDPKYK